MRMLSSRSGAFKLGIALSVGNCVAQSKSVSAPVWVAAMIAELGVPARTGGLIVGAEFLTLALAILTGTLLLRRMQPSGLFVVGMILSALGNIACLLNAGLAGVFVGRVIAGIGEGALYVAVYSQAARSPRRTHLYSVMQATILVYVVLIMSVTPSLVDRFGFRGAFAVLLVFSLLGLITTFWMRSSSIEFQETQRWPLTRTATALALGGIILLSMAQNGIWTYAGVIGTGLRLPYRSIANMIVVALLVAAVAVALTPYLSRHLGVKPVFVANALLLTAGTTVFSLSLNVSAFMTSLAAAAIGYMVVITLTYSILGERDPAGRLAAVAPISVHIGSSAGAILMGIAVEGGNLQMFAAATAVLTLIGAALVLKSSQTPRDSASGAVAPQRSGSTA